MPLFNRKKKKKGDFQEFVSQFLFHENNYHRVDGDGPEMPPIEELEARFKAFVVCYL